jgi:dipeptidyl aminopeptidase/acylaminoacyl peptidase
MALARGSQFNSYLIGESIGVGGMGEVYRATDTNLKREVAIKVLPESFAADADRLARFQREAEVLAALNHVNIAHIYGLERSGSVTALVMELVDGQTLAERLEQGALPADEALNLALQIAEALEAAHDKGIVHRDLKPANIKLASSGVVKVLDFGIAKALDTKTISGPQAAQLTTPAMTEAGIVLGTAAYMSPEQARGKPVDQRADIWAFGCLLYEMLTGQPAFGGEDVTTTLARILERGANMDALPRTLPPAVQQTLRLCLEKDPRKRIRHIGDVKLALAGGFEAAAANNALNTATRSRTRLAWSLCVAAVIAAGILTIPTLRHLQETPPPAPRVTRFSVPLAAATPTWLGDANSSVFGRPSVSALAMSPDGTLIAYTGWEDQPDGTRKSLLYLYSLEEGKARVIADSEDVGVPFFSPDGNWLGYVTGQALMRVPVTGGAAERIALNPMVAAGITSYAISAHWGENDSVVVTTNTGTVWTVPATGGTAEELVAAQGEDEGQGYRYGGAQWLPGGTAVLMHRMLSFDPARAELVAFDPTTRASTLVLPDAADARYLGDGRLLFVRQGNLMAVKFDPATQTINGAPILLQAEVMQAWAAPNSGYSNGMAQYAVSAAGHLVYANGGMYPLVSQFQIQRLGPDGATNVGQPQPSIWTMRVSPQGERVLFSARQPNGGNRIYLHDLARDLTTLLISDAFSSAAPVWNPDGTSVLYLSDRDGTGNIYSQPLDGSSAPRRLAPSQRGQTPADWSSQGAIIWFEDRDIWTLSAQGEAVRWLATADTERWARFSPDGQWLAYTSNASGRDEVYVRPFPGPGQPTQISGAGGEIPLWSRDGRTLYFREPHPFPAPPVMMQVAVTPGTPFGVSRAEPLAWLDPRLYPTSTPTDSMDMLADGSFLVALDLSVQKVLNNPATAALPIRNQTLLDAGIPVDELQVVLNFAEELKERLP